MFFLPISVDVPMERWPWMNWVMMAVIALCFLWQRASPETAERFILGGDGYLSSQVDVPDSLVIVLDDGDAFDALPTIDEHPLSWIGHLFLHADFLHLAGNLVFMWVFGNAVCAKIGNVFYPLLWVGTGVIASMAEMALSDGALLGASGAISGVMGFYVVYYLLNDITVFYFFFFRTGMVSLSSYWIVMLYTGLDLLGAVTGGEGVAYIAHLGGAVAGCIIALALLKLNLVQATDQERTLLDVMGGGGARRRGRPEGHVDRALMMRRLHVHVGDGNVSQMIAAELLGRARDDSSVYESLVSEDGRTWVSLREWTRRAARRR